MVAHLEDSEFLCFSGWLQRVLPLNSHWKCNQ